MFEKILVPIDGSQYAFKAAKVAASLADQYDALVTLINVVVIPVQTSDMVIPDTVINKMESEAQELLTKAAEFFGDRAVKTVVKIGPPSNTILEEAKDNYDLIVVGSRGLGEIGGFLLGSVSDRISHHAKCPVLVVH